MSPTLNNKKRDMIFVSYSRLDKPFVDRLCTALLNDNFKVWRDEWKLGYGDSLTTNIRAAIGQASFLLVVLSDFSLASSWVEQEIQAGLLAEDKSRPLTIVPLVIRDCEIPVSLKDRVFVDFRTDFDGAIRRLLDFLQRQNERDGSHGLSKGSDYYLFHASEAGWSNKQPFVDFEVVSLDREERYCVLTQIHCVGDGSATGEYFQRSDSPSLRQWVLRACAQEFTANPARVLIRGSDVKIANFSLEDAGCSVHVNVQTRIKKIGDHSDRTLLFNFGALFGQISDGSESEEQAARS